MMAVGWRPVAIGGRSRNSAAALANATFGCALRVFRRLHVDQVARAGAFRRSDALHFQQGIAFERRLNGFSQLFCGAVHVCLTENRTAAGRLWAASSSARESRPTARDIFG